MMTGIFSRQGMSFFRGAKVSGAATRTRHDQRGGDLWCRWRGSYDRSGLRPSRGV